MVRGRVISALVGVFLGAVGAVLVFGGLAVFADPDIHRSMLRALAALGALSVLAMCSVLLMRAEDLSQEPVRVSKPRRRRS
jgi:uncharacterized protein YjeT (DUF2065 family)